jgi:CheY-like chemotaxis protein
MRSFRVTSCRFVDRVTNPLSPIQCCMIYTGDIRNLPANSTHKGAYLFSIKRRYFTMYSSKLPPTSSGANMRYSNTLVLPGALVHYFERPCMPSAPHVLIAEDHAAVRNLLITIVARTYPTCTITAVADGAEAVAAFQAHGADLVITDYAMPIMTGLALIQSLRAQQATIPILVMSMNTAIAEAVLQAGANRFLAKPFTLPDLQQALIDLLPP